MEKIIEFEKGFNCIDFKCNWDKEACKPNTGGSHGVHGMNIRFVLKGELGAVQFLLYTGWIPKPTKGDDIPDNNSTIPADLGFHSPLPMYDGHKAIEDKCNYLDGKPCYYGGSGLNAYPAFWTLVNAGIDEFWNYMQEYYDFTFGDGKFPEMRKYHKERR